MKTHHNCLHFLQCLGYYFWQYVILGGSGGIINSLDFCPASLTSLGCFYIMCLLSSQWKG